MILLELYESIHAPVWPVLPVRIRGFRTKIELATIFIGGSVKKLYSFFRKLFSPHFGKTMRGRRWPVCLYSLPSGSPRFCCAAGAAGFCPVAGTGAFFTGFLRAAVFFAYFAGFMAFFTVEIFDMSGFFKDFAGLASFFTDFTGFADFLTGFLIVFLTEGFAAVLFVVFSVFLEDTAFAFVVVAGFLGFFTVLFFEVLLFTILPLLTNINIWELIFTFYHTIILKGIIF